MCVRFGLVVGALQKNVRPPARYKRENMEEEKERVKYWFENKHRVPGLMYHDIADDDRGCV